jgi:hypothetical protein
MLLDPQKQKTANEALNKFAMLTKVTSVTKSRRWNTSAGGIEGMVVMRPLPGLGGHSNCITVKVNVGVYYNIGALGRFGTRFCRGMEAIADMID